MKAAQSASGTCCVHKSHQAERDEGIAGLEVPGAILDSCLEYTKPIPVGKLRRKPIGVCDPEGRAGPLYSSTAYPGANEPSNAKPAPMTPVTVSSAGL
jgi:hypothetical protein